MPGADLPDWTQPLLTPAINLATISIAAPGTTTLTNLALPAGTHAVKVFITTGLAAITQAQVLVHATGEVIDTFTNPTSPTMAVSLDDVSCAAIDVAITTGSATQVSGSVVAMLSDQAVFVANDQTNPVAVERTYPTRIVGGVGFGIAVGATTAPGTYGGLTGGRIRRIFIYAKCNAAGECIFAVCSNGVTTQYFVGDVNVQTYQYMGPIDFDDYPLAPGTNGDYQLYAQNSAASTATLNVGMTALLVPGGSAG